MLRMFFAVLYAARLLTNVRCNLFIFSVENVSNKNVFPTVSRHSGRMYTCTVLYIRRPDVVQAYAHRRRLLHLRQQM